jgi:hypothetical protein
MSKTKDGGFLLDDSELSPYKADGMGLEEDSTDESKDLEDDK